MASPFQKFRNRDNWEQVSFNAGTQMTLTYPLQIPINLLAHNSAINAAICLDSNQRQILTMCSSNNFFKQMPAQNADGDRKKVFKNCWTEF